VSELVTLIGGLGALIGAIYGIAKLPLVLQVACGERRGHRR